MNKKLLLWNGLIKIGEDDVRDAIHDIIKSEIDGEDLKMYVVESTMYLRMLSGLYKVLKNNNIESELRLELKNIKDVVDISRYKLGNIERDDTNYNSDDGDDGGVLSGQ